MKNNQRATHLCIKSAIILPCAFIAAGLLFCAGNARAQTPPGFTGGPTNTPLASWSFHDQTNWTSDQGRFPISFTNLNFSWLGDGDSLVLDTNLPAWLNFNVIEPGTGATNLILNAPASITFWYAPDWATTNGGPGQSSQLVDIGEWTSNSSYGYWGLSVDSPGSNLWFLAQDGAGNTYGLSTPISWTTNYFHYVALTYSSTNVSIYVDGQLATNDPGGLSIWPGSTAVSGGMYFGSDTNGLIQASGLFNTVETYSYPLASNDVEALFNWNYVYYTIDPFNVAMEIISEPSNPSGSTNYYNAITGQGGLQFAGSVTAITSSNVWLANVTASVTANGMLMSFTIQGGSNGVPYDVFANSILDFSSNTNKAWAWMGQGYHGDTYTLTNMPSTACFLILGTPQDSDANGLTDAYELLVSKTNPYVDDQDGSGLPNSWQVLLGLNPLVNQNAQPGTRSNYSYTKADWLNGISGIRSGSITNDPEGNVISVSQ